MIDYRTVFTNTDGVAFPNTKAVNVTTPGAGDGTEFIAAGVNDSWGFHQALMDYAGLTPDSVGEAPGTSQMVEAMRRSFGAPGEVVLWHGQADPATLNLRLLILQGQTVLMANYPLLDAACYVGDTNNSDLNYKGYVHTSDIGGTIRDTAGPYLLLPECRGLALRGWDPTGIHDEFGATRKFPDRQWHALEVHEHEIQSGTSGDYAKVMDYDLHGGGNDTIEMLPGDTGDRLRATAVEDTSSSNLETRMKNYSVKICVRY